MRQMPIPTHEDLPSKNEPDDDLSATNETEADETAASDESQSEVSMRISLLGKLIIPRVSP
jgi:hypothetical protein